MGDCESELARAMRHVAEGRRMVVEQCERISRLKAMGYSTAYAERTLEIFLKCVKALEDHEQSLRRQAAE
jgi:hypothetical protein